VRALIASALRTNAADTIARPDYALAATGAVIDRARTSTPYRPLAAMLLRLITRSGLPKDPQVVLDPDMTIGSCFAFEGTQGSVSVRLPQPIAVNAVTVDHVSPLVAQNLGSAPRGFRVVAFAKESDRAGDELPCVGGCVLEYSLAEGAPQAQTFELEVCVLCV
jgi:hypothetical protein